MSIEISHEAEARITSEAQRQGLSVEALLTSLISAGPASAAITETKTELPAWNLGSVDALHRRDLYEEAR